MAQLLGTSPYETWVLTLRAWREDPTTPLDHLPVLAEEMYTPDVFMRLVAELSKAAQAVSDRFHDRLVVVWRHAHTPHDLARELISLRAVLARRHELATHPSLPSPIREALEKGLREDVTRWQRELEEAIQHQHSRSSLDSGGIDRMLRIVRENSFVSALKYTSGPHGSRPALSPLPESTSSGIPSLASRPRRRVVPHPHD